MKLKRLALEAGLWYGWQEVPVPHPGWGASPIHLIDVRPAPIGRGILQLSFIQALHPVSATRRSVDFRVVAKTASCLAGSFAAADGSTGTAMISVADIGWIQGYCPRLWWQRPPKPPGFVTPGEPSPAVTPDGYLNATLGGDVGCILLGATRQSFGCRLPAMPKRTTTFTLDMSLDPFESWLAARGFVPQMTEDRWFIHLDSGCLFFRRNWTGVVIYSVEADWRGDCLHLGQVTVNRNPTQYTETDDAHDRRLLIYLIRTVLLGVPTPVPMKDGAQAA
jgi:hypothetical protein